MVLVRSKPSSVAEKGLLAIRAWTIMNHRDTVTHDNLLAVYVEVIPGKLIIELTLNKMPVRREGVKTPAHRAITVLIAGDAGR